VRSRKTFCGDRAVKLRLYGNSSRKRWTPVGVFSPRNVRNSERVKPGVDNEDVDFAALRPKAPNPIMQHPNKLQSYKSQRRCPRTILGKLEPGSCDFACGLTVLPGVSPQNRTASVGDHRWNSHGKNNCPEQNFQTNRIHNRSGTVSYARTPADEKNKITRVSVLKRAECDLSVEKTS
jgi:hypothetical protein